MSGVGCEMCRRDRMRGAIVLCVFFFQAEAGIRVSLKSRGLENVLRRKGQGRLTRPRKCRRLLRLPVIGAMPCSYSHLTLPTKRGV